MAGLQEAGAAFGLAVPIPAAAVCEVWAENWAAVRLFSQAQTQWRMGPGGAIGLDYLALPSWCRPGAGGPRKARSTFAALQVMEAAALEHWEAARERK